MKVLIDTNVIIDVLNGREPYFEASAAFLRLCPAQITGLITTSQTTDIFYLLCRECKDKNSAKDVVRKLRNNLKFIDVTPGDADKALVSEMTDYEDALIAFCGKRHKADYVVTRNKKDYIKSPVPVFSPQEFLNKFFSI